MHLDPQSGTGSRRARDYCRSSEYVVAPVKVDTVRARHVPPLRAAALGEGFDHCLVVFRYKELDRRPLTSALGEPFHSIEGMGAKMQRTHV